MLDAWSTCLVVFAALAAAAIVVVLRPTIQRRMLLRHIRNARRAFVCEFERVCAEHFALAVGRSESESARWLTCAYRAAGLICVSAQWTVCVLVPAEIRLRLESGDAPSSKPDDDVLRAAAVFVWDGRRWCTDGRTIRNCSPDRVLAIFGHEFRPPLALVSAERDVLVEA